MVFKVNWDEFKEFKQNNQKIDDNFIVLLDFIKSYYRILNPADIFDILKEDEVAVMMLEKRNITDAEDLENYLYKLKNG